MERCQEHMVVDGQVERSKKMNGVVERTRRCGQCGSLFKTFEITDDKLAFGQAAHDKKVMDVKRELGFYKDIVEKVKRIYEAERLVRMDIVDEYQFGKKDEG